MTDDTSFEEQCRRADERERAKRAKEERRDPYEVLGVGRDASLERIKKAYRGLVNKWHPDRHPASKKDECTARIIEINAAYEILSDPEQRAAYDKYGFTARGLGAPKHQRGGGGPSIDDILAGLFEKHVDRLIRLARENADLFHDADSEPYAHAKVDKHRETYHVRSRAFELWLRRLYFNEEKTSVPANMMTEALATLTMFAVVEGPEVPVHVRIAEHGNTIYIDIGDKDWNAIEVTAGGWKVVPEPPVRFTRSSSMRPLPTPKQGGSIETLRNFLNVKPRDENTGADELVLLVAYAVAALRPNSNYPVLCLAGEQGSGKTSIVRFLGSLIDPRSPQLRTMPADERDLIVAARHAHFIAFDNISGLSDSMSDAICRLSTGGGHGERELYTNREESTFEGRRPVCLNGIEDVVTRPDLVERALMLLLVAIAPNSRRDEKETHKDFAAEAPAIFGALLDGLVAGLLNLSDLKIINTPRMADFALWAEACSRAYWPAETFLRAYWQNIEAANEVVLEASPVGDVVRNFMAGREKWAGTASSLLALLTPLIPEVLARERSWPKSARALSGKLRRAAPPLRKVGIDITFVREGHDRERIIVITAGKIGVHDFASAPSAGTGKSQTPGKLNVLGADGMRTPTQNADANERYADANVGAPSSANRGRDNGFSKNADHADDADANFAASTTSNSNGGQASKQVPCDYDAIPAELALQGNPTKGRRTPELCDNCGTIGKLNPWNWPGRPDGIVLHSSCEAPWFDSERRRR
jgi:DnaJ domain